MAAFDSSAFDSGAFDVDAGGGTQHDLTGAASGQANASASGAITQVHVILGAAALQANTTPTGAISLSASAHNLDGATCAQVNATATASITQDHTLSGSASVQGNTSAGAALSQVHALNAANCAQANAADTGAVTSGEPSDPRYARPEGDVTAGNWLPSTGTDLFAMIDEATADSADYIETYTAGACEVALNNVDDPGTSSGQVVRYQAWSDTASGLTVHLKQGAAIIASWTHAALPASPTMYEQNLTAMECDAITDYGDLRFAFVAL